MAKRKFDREQILAFLELIKAITLAESPEQALQKLMEKTAEVLDVGQGCILLTDPENKDCLKIECGFEQSARPKGWRVELKKDKHPNLYRIMFEEPVFVRQAQPRENVDQVLYIRLDDGEKIKGVMVFGAKGEKKEFTEDDLLIAQAISHLAIANLQHGRTLEKNERLSQRMTLADEIKNPLVSAGGFVRLIEKELKGQKPDQKILNYLKITLEEFTRIEELLAKLLKTT